ncbi:MAG: efflux RND transporter permease subunit [Amylibacter sp.]|nr:efflux RND transporter permease subunit [Amylibacter sp.]
MNIRLLPSSANGILSYFTRHGTAANLILIVMLVLGVTASTQIRSQFFPDVVIDNVTVSMRWDGAGPEDVDDGIVALLEPALLSVEGIESTASTASEGRAVIRLNFQPGWDMARAAADVKVAVDAVIGLPSGADAPNVRRGAWRDRVTDVVISGPVSADQLSRFADELTVRLFAKGVTRVTIRGVSAPEISVDVSEASLIQNKVSLLDIANAINQESEADPAGNVAGGTARVRTGVAKKSAEEIENIIIRSKADGSKLLVGDVANILVSSTDAKRSYYVADNPAVSVRVDRSDQGDAIGIQSIVQNVADEMELSLPKDVKIDLIRTRAQAIQDRLSILIQNGLMGLGLVVGLLFLFLSARTAFWVAAGIPAAMFAAIAIMYAAGLTLNLISLFGLIITLGIVVDDAIVVGEHADFRARTMGESPVEAAENAATRMASPVFAATITTILAFWGLTLIGGRFGSLISDIPFTVIAVLMASLIECFLILPNHMSHSLTVNGTVKWYDIPSYHFNRGFTWFKQTVFRKIIKFVLIFRYPVFAGAVLLLMLNVALFTSGQVNFRFFNAPERGSISGNIAMLDGATRSDTKFMVEELQRAVNNTAKVFEEKYGTSPVTFSMTEVGGNTGRGISGIANKDNDLKGSIAIELLDADARPYSYFAFIGELQDAIQKHPLLETISFRGWGSGPGGDSLDVQLISTDSYVLKAAAEKLKIDISLRFPEVTSVEDDLPYGKEELILELTPQGHALGFTIDDIGRELRNRLNGIEAASFPIGTRTSKVIVGFPEAEISADFLDRTRLLSKAGIFVPLVDIVTVDRTVGFAEILRENGLRLTSVTGVIPEDDPKRAEEIVNLLESDILPNIAKDFGVEFRLSGLAEQEKEFFSDAIVGYMLCLLGIYLALTWIFSSWMRPMVVMSVIPFGAIGMIFGHWVMEVPLSMFSIVGMIGMSGIIINDSIVLVTTIDEYSERRGLVPGIVDACCDRFRPVLLTTLTTVLGLAPLLFEESAAAQFLKPTIITLSFGLGFGMFLVLLIVPSMVMMQKDFGRLFASLRRGLFGGRVPYKAQTALISATIGVFAILGLTLVPLALTMKSPPLVNYVMGSDAPALIGSVMTFLIGLCVVIVMAYLAFFLIGRKRG